MPTRIPSHRPPRLRTARTTRDDTARPNAAARGYRSKAHTLWRQAVLTRDAFACVACGRINQSNHADHIVPIAQGGERYDIANGQTLCIRCHSAKTAKENHAETASHETCKKTSTKRT